VTFINWSLLIGLVAVAVPVVIHLLNRSRARVIDWGAMRFLLASLTSQNRRILLEEIILLALRCLLVALVALAIARPFITVRAQVPWAIALPAFLGAVIALGVAAAMWQSRKARLAMLATSLVLALVAAGASAIERFVQQFRWASGQGERDVAIVLDASMSMTLNVQGKTNFADRHQRLSPWRRGERHPRRPGAAPGSLAPEGRPQGRAGRPRRAQAGGRDYERPRGAQRGRRIAGRRKQRHQEHRPDNRRAERRLGHREPGALGVPGREPAATRHPAEDRLPRPPAPQVVPQRRNRRGQLLAQGRRHRPPGENPREGDEHGDRP